MDRDPHKENQAGASGLTSTPTSGALPETTGDIVAEESRVKEKSRSTTAAKLALLGATFRELQSGACIVECGGVQRHFDSLEACRRFCAQIEGRV